MGPLIIRRMKTYRLNVESMLTKPWKRLQLIRDTMMKKTESVEVIKEVECQ